MNRNTVIGVVAIAVLGAAAAYFFYTPAPQQEQLQVQAPQLPPPPALPVVRQIIEASPEITPLPTLNESDAFVLEALSGLIGDPELVRLFVNKQIIHCIVATIDNLPRSQLPADVIPVAPAPGRFVVAGSGNNLIISPENAVRYAHYMKIAASLDTKALVNLYVTLYPLFQEAYEDLGYPKGYFNDRLLVAIDDLLASQDISEPVRLVQPKVYYQYANPLLEDRSIGQRILMRIGKQNRALLMSSLAEIRQELKLHMREIVVEDGKG